MGLTTISPSQLRTSSSENAKPSKGLGGISFLEVSSAVGGTAATTVGALKGYQAAGLVTAAASGIGGAPGAFGVGANASSAPYLGTASTPFGSGGYSTTGATFAGGYSGYGASVSVPGGSGSVSGVSGAPSQDFQEKQVLFQQMNDANWQMLTAQITVNELSKNYQASSNILKTKSDTELNAVRNMRA